MVYRGKHQIKSDGSRTGSARILPLGDDLDAVADLERFGTIARSFSCHMDSSHSRR